MDYRVLTDIGLTANEAKTYLALLQLKKATVKAISEKAEIHRRNVYEALAKLELKGLAVSVVDSGARHFEPTNPEQIFSYLREKEDRLKKYVPELLSEYRQDQETDEAAIFRGMGGIKAILQDMLKVKSDLCMIGSKGYWKTLPELRFFFPQFDKKRIKLGIRMKQIFDFELKNKRITKFELGECRFFPKEYSTPILIWIYGNRVVSLFYSDSPIAFMIKSQKIANGYRKYFNFMWQLAEERN